MDKETKRKYGDIIDLEHHRSSNFKHMTMYERAAQFSPFAALVGHSDSIKETARLTEEFIELTEEEKNVLNEKLQILIENVKINPEIVITEFVPDKSKSGGKYEQRKGRFYRYNDYIQAIEFVGGELVKIKYITEIECELFLKYENL